MRTKALTITELERVNANSASQLRHVELQLAKAAVLAGDGYKERRLAARECRGCHYTSRGCVVGHAFTDWNCALCSYTATHSNTGVPRVCNSCSDAFGLCVTCGGDIDMRHRGRRERRALRPKKGRKRG